jgi:hypothetical protein
MKYVYIIIENCHEFDCDKIHGIYSTRELAEKYIPDSLGCNYSYYILTQEVTEE